MVFQIALIVFVVLVVLGLSSNKFKSNHHHTWTKEDSEELRRTFEANRMYNEKLSKEMEIRKEERRNNKVVSEEVRKEREKTWDYYDIG